MKQLVSLSPGTLVLCLTVSGHLLAADAPPGGIRLLPGYEHRPLQGIDSIVGEIRKEGGLRISYEIGGLTKPGGITVGGQFSDRPKLTPRDQVRWYLEQTVNKQPAHLAYRKDSYLLVSFPQKGINFRVMIRSADEMAEALLMILTYPGPPAAEASDAHRSEN
ncbi:MAG: hypothetical protein PVH68_13515 [Armatimonadota bacterium]|jgi:hypothetical protein